MSKMHCMYSGTTYVVCVLSHTSAAIETPLKLSVS